MSEETKKIEQSEQEVKAAELPEESLENVTGGAAAVPVPVVIPLGTTTINAGRSNIKTN